MAKKAAVRLMVVSGWEFGAEDEFIFFFQAEDGIRDDLVTGVQTLCSSDLTNKSSRVFGVGVLALSKIFPSGVRLANLIPVPPISIVAMVIAFTCKKERVSSRPLLFSLLLSFYCFFSCKQLYFFFFNPFCPDFLRCQ